MKTNPATTSVAVMQPTFLPWLGYFALIDRVDEFVYLDDVQLSRQSWQSRNRIRGSDKVLWLSLPLRRKPSRPTIAQAQLAEGDIARPLTTTLIHTLSAMPHRDLVIDIVRTGFEKADGNLSRLNRFIIEEFCNLSGITTKRHQIGALDTGPETSRTERLVKITRQLGGSVYISPPSAHEYLAIDNPFRTTEISLRFFNYAHPTYPQRGGSFTPYMSAVEAMAALGPEKFRALIRSGVRSENQFEDLLTKEPARG